MSDALHWPSLERRLARLARGTRVGTLITLIEPLPASLAPCQERLPTGRVFDAWVRADADDWRIGLGHAAVVESGGSGRFSALAAAHRAWSDAWRCDDSADSGLQPLAWAGFAFAADTGAGAPLPNARLAVPAVLLWRRAGRSFLLLTCVAERVREAPAHWRALLAGLAAAVPPQPVAPLRPLVVEDAEAWEARIDAALERIASGAFDKVVLGRSVRLKATQPLDPARAFAALAADYPRCAVFAAGGDDALFLGATPERLVALKSGNVMVDALAGTAWTGAEPLSGDKNRREHSLVANAVVEALAPLCGPLSIPPQVERIAVGDIEHLRLTVAGLSRPGVGLFDLAACLHPTPAVGGTPTAAALDWLAASGERRGGWYSGAVGWVDRGGDGELAVALRCGLLTGRGAELYAGAGIVAGSNAAHEFKETEMKLKPMLRALGMADSALPAMRSA